MINGLWTVEFISTHKRYGKGVLIINENRLLGGDEGYYYTGNCNITDNIITGTITIIRYDRNIISVFGDIDKFELNISGQINENMFNVIAHIDGHPEERIQVNGTKKEDY